MKIDRHYSGSIDSSVIRAISEGVPKDRQIKAKLALILSGLLTDDALELLLHDKSISVRESAYSQIGLYSCKGPTTHLGRSSSTFSAVASGTIPARNKAVRKQSGCLKRTDGFWPVKGV